MRGFINWLMTMFKSKNCLECGHNNFCITETIKYNAHIDAKTKLLFTDCMIMSNIEKVFCINRGTEQNRAEFGEVSTLTD